MLLHNKIEILINSKTFKYYKSLYSDIKCNEKAMINVIDLPRGSHVNIRFNCDNCNVEFSSAYRVWIKKIGKDYCKKCSSIKSRKTMLDTYGVEHPLEVSEILDKMKENINTKYGVDNISKLNFVKDKKVKTSIENYNFSHPQKNEEIRNKTKETNLLLYGFETPLKNDEVKNKTKTTLIEKWGVDVISKNKDIIKLIQLKTKETRIKKAIEYYKDYNIVKVNYDNKVYTLMCNKGHEYDIPYDLLRNRKRVNIEICTVCKPLNSGSSGEDELYEFIKNNCDLEIIRNRKILDNLEIDIYIPSINIGFEFNGLYWHNEINKEKSYHLKKTIKANKKGIHLIHIWEDDWNYKKDIVKSIVLNYLNKNSKIMARKCQIVEIDNKTYRKFLEDNHIQSIVNAKVKIGLLYKNELVSIISFGSLRKNLNSSNVEYHWELLRFCNKINCNVIGGFSKLLSYFRKNYKSNSIISYADRSRYDGKAYLKSGFEFIKYTEINYSYIVGGIRRNRFNYRKDILIKDGFDESKSEHSIMLDRKIYRIYDCGSIKFELK